MEKCCNYIEKLVAEMDSIVKERADVVARDNVLMRSGFDVPDHKKNKEWLKDRFDRLEILKKIQKMVYYCHDEMIFCPICGELQPASNKICEKCSKEQNEQDFNGAPSKSAMQGLEGSLI